MGSAPLPHPGAPAGDAADDTCLVDQHDSAGPRPGPPSPETAARSRLSLDGRSPLPDEQLAVVTALFDAIPGFAMLVTEEHHVVLVNRACRQALMQTAVEICGQHCPRAFHGTDEHYPGCPLRESVSSGGLAEAELHATHGDRWVRTIVAPTQFLDLAGHRVYLHTVADITERKRFELRRGELVDAVIRGQDAERQRVARDLHDGTAQAMAALAMRLGAIEARADARHLCEDLSWLRRQATAITEDLRRMAHGLHPSLLDNLGLAEALERHIADFTAASGVPVSLHVTGLEQRARLDGPLALSLYRIAQEALSNVAKHARACRASVVVNAGTDEVTLIVEDDGVGIDMAPDASTGEVRAGLGLTSVRERASLFGGTVVLEGRPEGGTALFVRVPLKQAS